MDNDAVRMHDRVMSLGRLKSVAFFLSLVLALAGCGDGGGDGGRADAGDDAAQEVDTDGDGVTDAMDPTPNGSTLNVLNGSLTDGQARVVAIAAVDAEGLSDPALVYDANLEAPCDDAWAPPGLLCDDDTEAEASRHDPDVSIRTSENSGATWYALDGEALVRGELVIDACAAGGCEAVDFREARVFQMFSDGKTTAIRVFVHPTRSDTPPAWDDAGWLELGTQTSVGPGATTDDGITVTEPTVIDFGATYVTRYVRLEVVNDGTHGDASYTELRSVKLFGAPPP